MVVTTILY